jgi:hypothetical protein
VQIIDSAVNCTYSIYKFSDEQFSAIFRDGSDLEFIEDVESRMGEVEFGDLHSALWGHPIEKTEVVGIHGTLFYGLGEAKRRLYPNKRFYDDVYGFSATQRQVFKIIS